MKIDELDTLYIIDKKIIEIYQKIKLKEIRGKSYKNEINKLGYFIDLENYLLNKLNSNVNLDNVIEKLQLSLGEIGVQQLALEIMYNNMEKLENNDVYDLTENEIIKLTNMRLYTYLKSIKYKNVSEDGIRIYNIGGVEIPQLEDITNVYIEKNYISFYQLNPDEFINYADKQNEKVYTLNTECKKILELESCIDLYVGYIFLLDTIFSENKKDYKYYVDNMYNFIFMSKELEDRVIKSSFNLDELFSTVLHNDKLETNKKFINIYRSHISYDMIIELLSVMILYDIDKLKSKYEIIVYNMNIIMLKMYLIYLNSYDYNSISNYKEYYQDVSNIASELSVKQYKTLHKMLEL